MSGKLVKSSSRVWTNLLAKQIYLEAPVELEIIQTEGRTRFTDAHAGSAAARPPSISQAQSNFRILELLGRHLALASLHQTTTRHLDEDLDEELGVASWDPAMDRRLSPRRQEESLA